jgi:hypothetical protein
MQEPADFLGDHQPATAIHGDHGIRHGICYGIAHGMNRGTDYGRWQSCSIRELKTDLSVLSHGAVDHGRQEWLPQSETVPWQRF